MTDGGPLVLGPIVRGTAASGLSVWVETSRSCEVTVLGRTVPTFQIAGHFYALVDLAHTSDAAPGTISYTVSIGGEQVWPTGSAAGEVAKVAIGPHDRLQIMAGSCRQQAPQPLWLRRPSAGFGDLGPDALATLANEIRTGRREPPDLLMLTGDQVYADEQHPTVRAALRDRRGGPPAPGRPEVTSFEEYTWLYQKTWSHPIIRELLASVPSLMVFDDHDVIDDWNISASWVDEMGRTPWWQDRIRSGLMAYWVYQHLGNLPPKVRITDEVYRAVVAAEDGEDILAEHVDRLTGGTTDRLAEPWSYRHRSELVDLVAVDSRNARVLDPSQRSMLAPADWAMISDALDGRSRSLPTGGRSRHVLLVTSVPWALPVGIHRLQQLVSGFADRPNRRSRWRPKPWSLAERFRQAVDLEHWAAFGQSYYRLLDLLKAGSNPTRTGWDGGSTIVLSGDIHFGYVAEIDVGPDRPPVHQVVASPLRQAEMSYERAARRLTMSNVGRAVIDRLAALSLARTGGIAFRMRHGPVFQNNIATITYEPDRATVTLERVETTTSEPRLVSVGTTEI